MRVLSIVAVAALGGCAMGSMGSAPQAAATSPSAVATDRGERPGLGTSWGERVYSPLEHTRFERASDSPWAEVALHYDDAEGTAAHADYLAGGAPRPVELPAGDGGISIGLIDDSDHLFPGYTVAGRTLVVGEDGARYRIVVHNATSARFEVVASVDGLDVIDGHPADPERRGYLVDPHDSLVIDGFRTSDREVAAFRFGKVADSYAARTSGDRDVGVIGFAVFAERGARWSPPAPAGGYDRDDVERRDTADPFPARGYAAPPPPARVE